MKNFLITILVICGIFYLMGEISDRWFIFHFDDIDVVDPLVNLVVFICISGGLMLLGFLLAVSLLGALVLGFGAALLGVIFVGAHLFWPVLFLALIFYLVLGSSKQRV